MACQNKHHPPTESAFQKTLVKKEIKGTFYYLCLPVNYVIKKTDGPDFSIYYFYPSDINDKKSFRGGFYLGNAPGEFDRSYDSCKVENLHSPILGVDKIWTLYNCEGQFSTQIITNSESGMAWAQYIHAFGKAGSENEINKLLVVYSTLSKKQ